MVHSIFLTALRRGPDHRQSYMDSQLRAVLDAYYYYCSPEFVGPRMQHELVYVVGPFKHIELSSLDDLSPLEICTPVPYDFDYEYRRTEIPKPIKQKRFIKEPRRQSFRQSMRSVNRNR